MMRFGLPVDILYKHYKITCTFKLISLQFIHTVDGFCIKCIIKSSSDPSPESPVVTDSSSQHNKQLICERDTPMEGTSSALEQ